MRALGWIAALSASLALHLGFVAFGSSREATVLDVSRDPPTRSTPNHDEIQAVEAFAALDGERALNAMVQEAVAQIPELDLPEIPLPEPKPTPKAKPEAETPPQRRAAEDKEPTQPAQPTASEAQAQPASAPKAAPAPSPPAFSQAQITQANANFQSAVHQAIGRAMKVPRNTAGVRAVVAVRFQNGRLVSYQIAQSSGHTGFDQAIINAVRSARYPQAHAALPPDVTYRIPMSIK